MFYAPQSFWMLTPQIFDLKTLREINALTFVAVFVFVESCKSNYGFGFFASSSLLSHSAANAIFRAQIDCFRLMEDEKSFSLTRYTKNVSLCWRLMKLEHQVLSFEREQRKLMGARFRRHILISAPLAVILISFWMFDATVLWTTQMCLRESLYSDKLCDEYCYTRILLPFKEKGSKIVVN